jgi:hypothetical protein
MISAAEAGPEGKGGVGGVSAVAPEDSVEVEWEDDAEDMLATDCWLGR